MKKLFLLVTPFVLATVSVAQTTTQAPVCKNCLSPHSAPVYQEETAIEMHPIDPKEVHQEIFNSLEEKAAEGKQLSQQEQTFLRLHMYIRAFLQTGKETNILSKDYTQADVLDAMVQAKVSEETVSDPELYVAEEFLQYMREHCYVQNLSADFSDALTPTFIAKVLRILQ